MKKHPDPENDDIELEYGGDEIKRLKTKLKETEEKAREYLAGWQRAKADYVNLKREEEEIKSSLASFAKKPVLLDLINLADTFDLAFANTAAWAEVPENWRRGVEHIHKEFLAVLERHGIEIIDPLGLPLDLTQHEPIATLETNDTKNDNRIVSVVKKGYALAGQVIRPAQVKVGILKAH